MEPMVLTPRPQHLDSVPQELRLLSRELGRLADDLGVSDVRPLDVLEAGCGRRWRLDLGARPLRITGVDRDAAALALRVEEQGDLVEAIHGDLRTIELPAAAFDAVYCSFVLEHVAGARDVLDRFLHWVRPGGLVLLRMPDRDSVYGWATRVSPHRLHVAFRRRVIGMPGTGTDGHGPYPVVYDRVVSRRGIHRWARARGVEIIAEYGSSIYLQRSGRLRPLLGAGVRVVAGLSAGRLTADYNNLTYVLRAPR